jgi:hypothetical protein
MTNKTEKAKRELDRANANLKTACEMIGWDEGELTHVLQTKNFLKACKKLDDLKAFEFENAMCLIAKSGRLKPYLEKMYELTKKYIQYVMDGTLRDLDGNKGENADIQYPSKIADEIRLLIEGENFPGYGS